MVRLRNRYHTIFIFSSTEIAILQQLKQHYKDRILNSIL